jgi:hypothetical protein
MVCSFCSPDSGCWLEFSSQCAEDLFRQAAQGRATTLGAQHSDALSSKHWQAQSLYKLQKYSEAEDLFRQVAQGRATTLGAQHSDTLSSKRWLEATLSQLKDSKPNPSSNRIVPKLLFQ